MDLYPAGRQRSAILPALYVIQREFGYCPIDAQNELAGMLELEPAEVGAVVDFYHMLHTEPKGEYHVEVCTNVPCMLRGADQCMHHFEEKLGIHHGETTADDQFSLDHMECLGSCGTAPMVSVTERKTGQIRYFEELDSADDVEKVLTLVKSGKAFNTLERWTPAGDPELTGKAAGPYRIGGMETRFLTARVFAKDSHKLATYEADGGYETAKRALTTMKPEEVAGAGQSQRHPRPWRRRLPDWAEMELPGARLPALPGGQRGRVRAGHLQRPHHHGVRPAPVARRHSPERLRDQGGAGFHLHPRRVLFCLHAAGGGAQGSHSQRLPGREDFWHRLQPEVGRPPGRRRL